MSRIDLRAGQYGVKYAEAKASKAKPGDRDYRKVAAVKYDPDTYLYQRSEDTTSKLPTHSMFITVYGATAPATTRSPRTSGNPTRLRSQYQDTAGNRWMPISPRRRLLRNATSNLPDMYGKGFDTSEDRTSSRWPPTSPISARHHHGAISCWRPNGWRCW
uniref:hypothetical protein n=1 Tax=Xanthomonas oryzae TaxID=347 RepID=UPI003DA02749